jgi:hypothetical protein
MKIFYVETNCQAFIVIGSEGSFRCSFYNYKFSIAQYALAAKSFDDLENAASG